MLLRSLFRPSSVLANFVPRAYFGIAYRTPTFNKPDSELTQLERDDIEMFKYNERKTVHKPYLRMVQQWQKPLQKKRLRQQRIAAIKATKEKTPAQHEKIVIHNPAVGIEYPVGQQDYFVIADIDGMQCKIMENCRITVDNRPELDLNDKVVYDKVLMYSTKDFTCIGRPYLQNAKIQAVVEEKPQAQKLIVLKKKRRKQYRRSYGIRAKLTVMRVEKITYELGQQKLARAVSLE